MLSRLYDERVFTSSDDVVFSTSSSQALRRTGDDKSRRLNHESHLKPTPHAPQRRAMKHSDLEESKSDEDGGSAASADDELDSEDDEEGPDEEEARRLRGLKFPLQSPRHISASQSYLHRQRRRQLQQETDSRGHDAVRKAPDAAPLSPTSRRLLAQKLLDGANVVSHSVPQHTSVSAARYKSQARDVAVKTNTFHDRPMELVFLPTGEIRPRDECPPGLKLPLSSMAPVRMLREEEEEEVENTRRRAKNKRTVKSRREQSSEESSEESSGDEGHAKSDAPANRYERLDRRSHADASGEGVPRSRSYRPQAIETRQSEAKKATSPYTREDDVEYEQRVGTLQRREQQRGVGDEVELTASKTDEKSLQSELQKEKKRVLQKMTQLLEEQGKTQALQRKLEMYESKVAAMESELKACAGREEVVREQDMRIQTLSEQLRAKDERIARLEEAQIEAARAQEHRQRPAESRPINAKDEERVSRLRQREAALATQLEDLMNRVTAFHSRVETWKVNSRDALESCDKRADVIELMDRLWVDFPPFIADNRKTAVESGQESSTITFLTKKLRQKEDELRATQSKYVELKELCARQCIREADLQNFINENRLRGNLVIPNANNSVAQPRDQENQQFRANGHDRTRVQAPESDDEEDDGEADVEDMDEDEEVVVRRPRVFIDIKRADQHRQQPDIEHVRLAPSPGLAQRYREQQQHASVKPTSKTRSSVAATSNSTSRAATVASASRTLGATRQATARTSVTQKRTTTTTSHRRTNGVPRSVPVASRNSAATRASSTSRRLSTQPPLSSRPWV